MSMTHVPVVGVFTYRDADATPAAGEDIHFIAVSRAVVDTSTVTLPKKLICTLDVNGEVPDDFTLPTVGDGVYYKVIEKFSGGRDAYVIQVLTTDVEIDLATVVPFVDEIPGVAYLTSAAIGTSVASQAALAALAAILFKDEGADAATLDDLTAIDFVGAGVTATYAAGVLTVTVSGGGGGSSAWGGITGTLSDQTDLQTALNLKANTDDLGTMAAASTADYTPTSGLATVATTGAYADLSGKPTLGTAAAAATGDFLQPNTPITGATKTKITYDADGLVTAGADATTADIADSADKRYVTDANLTVIGNTSGTNTGDQTNISGNAATVTTNANLTGHVTSVGNAAVLGSFTVAQLNTAISDGDVATGGGTATGTNTGDQTTIVGISGTKAQFDTACSDGDFAYQGAAINMADTNLQRPVLLDYAVLRQAKGSVSGAQTIDITAGNAATATATGAITWTFSNPAPTGSLCAVFLRLTNGGAGAQTWPSGTVWDAATAPTLSASGVDELLFLTTDAGTSWRGFLCAKGQA